MKKIKRCNAITNEGVRCKRRAISNYCLTHITKHLNKKNKKKNAKSTN